ncbi:beta galactosidase jelly roll domain-containing protein, partial [Rubrivirga sp.]|uniref:beta galactosidase jelly roll domain-containing protein n=1 Tax=Rubrivirga sp. TaxID=1885344 RepID=UPI003C75A7AF
MSRRFLLIGLGALALLAIVMLLRTVAVAAFGALGDVLEGDTHTWQTVDETGVPQPDMQDWTTLVDLEGDWAFRIGDAEVWATGYDEAGWDTLAVPGIWEDQGYQGYDGTAWYRRTFVLDASAATEPLYLLLGKIDDSDEAFVNGVRIGRTGLFPPVYKTGYYDYRVYAVPPEILAPGENTIAVRVYDGGREGGIMDGPIALATTQLPNPTGPVFVADLVGAWQFAPGDDLGWASPDLEDEDWDTIQVPGVWERQGYRRHDGFAWYRKTVTLTGADANRDLLLVLGAIDDLDQAFVNGNLIGGTGDIEARTVEGDEWLTPRAYPIEAGLLHAGDNVIAVRVYDGPNEGGIHQGPVGLMTP